MALIGIRADADEKIATGHIMRCMSIALQLKKQGQDVVFILSAGADRRFLSEKGFESVCLGCAYGEKERELGELRAVVAERGIACLLVDSYDVTSRYLEALGERCRTVYLDDTGHSGYPADLLISYTYGVGRMPWEIEAPPAARGRRLCGLSYAPLREEFAGERISIRQSVEELLITTGGTDQYDMAVALLQKMKKLSGVRKHVVTGKFYHSQRLLEETAEADGHVRIYRDIPDMCRVMRQCDLAVSASGTTLVELCACGIPTVCFSVAENQVAWAKACAAAGMAVYAGDVGDGREALLKKIVSEVERLRADRALRDRIGKKGKDVTDGKGAARIAEEIRKLV